VVEHDVVAELGGLADDDAHAVIDEETPADGRPRVDLDARDEPGPLRDGAPQEVPAPPPQAIGDAVPPDGVNTRIQPEDLGIAARRRVTQARRGQVLADAGDDTHAAARRAVSASSTDEEPAT